MPWYFPWSDSIKKRAVRYLLQHYMGHFLKEKLSLDQLTVDLYSGTGTAKDISLDVAYINEVLDTSGVPVELVDGYIGSIMVSIPWSALISDNTIIEINDLELTIKPKQRLETGMPLDSMLFSSMTTSMQLAEECLKQEPTEGELRATDVAQPFEGLELFAQTIEAVLSRIKVAFNRVTVRLEHLPHDSSSGNESVNGVAVEFHIARIDYYDDLAAERDWSAGSEPSGQSQQSSSSQLAAIAVKNIHLTGVKIYCDEFRQELRTISRQPTNDSLCFEPFTCSVSPPRTCSQSPTGSISSPVVTNQPFMSTDSSVLTSNSSTAPQATTTSTAKPSSAADKLTELVLIAELTSRQEVKLRLKQNDELPGAKLELDCNIGCVNVHLSPHLLHLLIEVADGLSSPGDDVSGKHRASKPMADSDLERHLQHECRPSGMSGAGGGGNIFQVGGGGFKLVRQRGWSESSEGGMCTQPLDDSEDEDVYLSVGTRTDMDSSTCSMSSSLTSTATASSATTCTTNNTKKQKGNSRTKQRHKDPLLHAGDDNSCDLTRFKLKIAFLSIVVLHEDPSSVPQDVVQLPTVTPSMDRLRQVAEKYFDTVRRDVTIAGVSTQAGLVELRNAYSKACQLDHLGLLCKPITLEITKQSGSSLQTITADVTVGIFELIEAVFDQRPATASLYGFHLPIENVIPEYSELLVFVDDERQRTPMYTSIHLMSPCLKLHVKSYQSTATMARKGSFTPKTEVQLELRTCHSEVDVTVVDRIHALLQPRPVTYRQGNSVYRSLHYNAQFQSRQALFTETIDEDPTSRDNKLDVEIHCPHLTLHIRFPKVDLRVGVAKPWWKRNLHKERLIVELENAKFKCNLESSSTVTQLELMCRSGRGLFQRNSDDLTPFAFLHFSANNSVAAEQDVGFDWPRLVIKSLPLNQSVLADAAVADLSPPLDSLNGACEFGRAEPSPFSSRKVMYENEELVMPGDKRDIVEFIDKAVSTTQLHIDLNLPTVYILLPDAEFVELVYNRLLNDLVLWEPLAPAPLDTQEPHSFVPGSAWSPQFVAQLMHQGGQGSTTETFMACKPAAHYDSSSESDSEDTNFYSMNDARNRQRIHNNNMDRVRRQSRSCVTLNIGHGRLMGCIPLQSDQKVAPPHGRFLLVVDDSCITTVIGQNGDPDLQYLCVQLHQAQLYHNGLVDLDSIPTSVDFLFNEHRCYDNIQRTIYLSEDGVTSRLRGKVGHGAETEDMLTVAVRINNDTLRSIKKYVVALGIRGATLRHRTVESGLMWSQQILEFFNVNDFDIPGYSIPKVVMELHTHLWSCAVDYRPLYLTYRALVTMETFSISSNVIIDSPVSLLRFILDDGALFLSDKVRVKAVDVKKNYVCVIDVGTFEISLRTSSGSDARYPKMEIRASNNVINVRTCADSCHVLMELLNYLGTEGDLNGKRQGLPTTHDNTPVTLTPPSGGDRSQSESPKLSQRHFEQVHNLVADAMQESCVAQTVDHTNKPSGTSTAGTNATTNVYCYTSDERQQFIDSTLVSESLTSSQQSSVVSDDTGVLPPDRQSAPPRSASSPQPSSQTIDIQLTDSDLSDAAEQFSDNEDFCIIDEPGLGISSKDGDPVIRMLSMEPIVVIDDHFRMPVGKADILKPPEHFPPPVYRYTLSEISVTWSMFGGKDFDSLLPPVGSRVCKATSPKPVPRSRVDTSGSGWRVIGGSNRDHNTLMELQLNKIRVQYEVYPDHTVQASRQVLVVNDIEIRDRLALSKINKFLYQYSSDAIPRQSHASMLVIKAVHLRPDPTLPTEECLLKVSLQPLRLNVDQDALFFFRTFFTDVSAGFSSDSDSPVVSSDVPHSHPDPCSIGPSPKHMPSLDPVMTVGGQIVSDVCQLPTQPTDPEEMLLMFSEIAEAATARNDDRTDAQQTKDSNTTAQLPTYFKSFVFSPEVPIRLDYQGKWVDMGQGTLAGLLVGLAQLNCSELRLKQINHRHGLLGIDRVVAFALSEWLQDIKKNQLPSLLGGVGPMYSLVQLVQGCRDLFWLPVEQYRRDGRIVRGIQRGAHSFMTCTAMSTLELTNRLVQTIQFAAEAAYDMVSPGPSVRIKRKTGKRQRRLAQPADFREGFTNAVTIVTGGLRDTATNIYSVALQEHEHKGVTGAVGGVLRQIPSAVIEPVIIATEATSNVLGGMRNQLLPDRRLEDEQKWKTNDSD